MNPRATVWAARARLYRLYLFYGYWIPTTYVQPRYDRPYGANKII